MTRGNVWLGVVGLCGCCFIAAKAHTVYDDGGVLDNLYAGQFDSSFDIFDNATITLVPEPVCLSLLLMGTLLVRRKQNGGRMPQ